MEFLTFEPGEYQVLEDIEFDETIERDERIRFFTLEEQTVDAFEQMVPRGRTTRYKLEQIQKTVDRYADLYTTFVVPTAERYNIREPTYAKSFDWVYPIYSSSGFKTYNYTTSWSSLFRDPTLPNIYPRMLAALPRPFPDVPGTPYAFASTTEFLDDQGRNPRRALPAYEMTRTQLHEDKTFDVVRVPVSGTDDVVAFKGYYLAARTLDVPNPLDDHPFLKSNQSSTIETTAPLSEVVPSLDAILTHGVPATQHPYRDAVPYLNLYSVQLSDIPWSSWKSRFPPVEVISSTPALADIPYPKMDRQKPSEKLETLYRSPYSPGMANRYWLMNQVDGGDLVVQMLLSQSIDNGSVETMPSTGLNPAAYPETTLDDPACNLVGNTFGDFVVKGLVRRLNKSYTCVPLEFLQQERKQRGYTGRLAWKESTGSDLLKTHIQSLGTFFYPKETKTKAVPETRTPAGPDSLRRKEVVAIQADPRRFVADKLRDIQELLKETTLTNHIYSDPDGAFVMCEHTLAIMSNDLRDDRLKYYDTWTVIDGGFRVCRFCGQRINADVTLNQDEYDENGFKIVQSEAMGAVVATTDAIAGFTDDFAGLRGLFQEDSAIDSTVHMLLSILHVLPNPALLDSLLKMGRLRAGKPSDQRTDILKLRGTIGIALVVLLFHLSTPPLVPRRSFGSTPFKLTGYPRDSDTPESFTTTDSVLLAIRKTFEAFPTTLKGPSLVIIRETLAHTKKVREDVHKVISVFMKSKSEDDAWLGKAMSDARTAIKTIHAVDAKDAVVPFIRAIAPPPAEAMNTLQHFTACPTRRAIYASGRVPPVRQAEVRLDARIVSSPFRVDVSPSPSVRVEPTRVTKDVIRQQLASRVDSALATTFVKVNVHTNTLIASRIADAFRVPAKVRSIDPTQNAAEQRDLAQGLLRTVLASVQGDEANRAQLLKMATQDVALYMTLADYKKERANVNKLRATERLTFVDRMSKKNDQDRETVRELLKIGLAPYIISTQDRGLFAREAESIQDQIARDRRRLEEFLDDEGVVADVGAPRDTDDQDDPPPAGADNGDYGDTMPRTEGRDQIQPQIYDDAEEGV